MGTPSVLAICCGAALAFLALQQVLFAAAVMALLREGRRRRAETAQTLDAQSETFSEGLAELEARLRRVERRNSDATAAERATRHGSDERCRRTPAISDDPMTPEMVHDIDGDARARPVTRPPERARGECPPTPAKRDKASGPRSTAVAPRAAARPEVAAPARNNRSGSGMREASQAPLAEKAGSDHRHGLGRGGTDETTALLTRTAGSWSARHAERLVVDMPAMRVSAGGRLQRMSSMSLSSLLDGLEGAHAGTTPPRAQKRRPGPTPSTTRPRGYPTKIEKIRSYTGPVSSGSLFYANVVDKMRREGR